jgi:hypothetical protein
MLVGIQMHPVDGAAAGDGVGVKERTPGVLANLPNRICEAARSDIPRQTSSRYAREGCRAAEARREKLPAPASPLDKDTNPQTWTTVHRTGYPFAGENNPTMRTDPSTTRFFGGTLTLTVLDDAAVHR